MAIDPSIALQVRMPQVAANIPQPLEQFGQILSLHNLMTQGQLGQVTLQQKLLEFKQAQDLAKLMAGGDLTDGTGTAPMAPIAPVRPADVPAGGPSAAAPMTGPAGAPFDPNAPLQPILPAVSAPVPAASAAIAAPAAPAAQAAPPAFPSGGIAGLPSWQKMLQVGGAQAFGWIKNINEAHKSQLDIEKQQLENAQLQSKDMVRIANGMTDNESKNRLLPEAAAKGYITGDEARQFYAMDVNDPRFQARKDSWGQQALTYDQAVKLGFDRNEEARKQNEEVRKWVDFNDARNKESERILRERVMAIDDPSQFPALLNTPHLQSLYGGLVGKNLNDIRIGTGAGKVGETVPKPTSVTDAEAKAAGVRTAAETTSRINAEDLPYVGRANDYVNGKVRWDQLPPNEQEHVSRILSTGGVTPSYTTKLTDTENTKLTNLQTGLDAVSDLRKSLTGVKFLMTGPWADQLKELPVVGAKWTNLQSKMGMLKATVGDLIKGGTLRATDQQIYESMFPKLDDDPWQVQEKLNALEQKLTTDLGRYKENLRGQSRYIPGDTPPAAPAPSGAPYTRSTTPVIPNPSSVPYANNRLLRPPETPSTAVPDSVRSQLAGKPVNGTYDLRNKKTNQIEHWYVDPDGNMRQVP